MTASVAATDAPWGLGELLGPWLPEGLGAGAAPGDRVRGLTADSRQVGPGDVFLALPGIRSDGARFAGEAATRGAAAVLLPAGHPETSRLRSALPCPVLEIPALERVAGELAHRFHDRPSEHLTVVGITGTNGKSTVAHLVAGALSAPGGAGEPAPGAGVMGTLGWGPWGALEPSGLTTADALVTHARLARLRAAGVGTVCMEVSSHALTQNRVAGVRFEAAVLTQLGRDHLDYHPSREAYARAKAGLFEWPGLRCAVLNADDPLGRRLVARLREGDGPRVLAWSVEGARGADVRGRVATRGADGIRVSIEPGPLLPGPAVIDSPLIGRFNGANLVAAWTTLLGLGVAPGAAAEALARVPPPPGRMERVAAPEGRGPLVVVDFAHTPDALAAALGAARELLADVPPGPGGGRLWCVFGCGGERDRGKRGEMGRVAARLADRVVVTSDNPRGEPPEAIAEEILEGARAVPGPRPDDEGRLRVRLRREAAIAEAVQEAGAGDVVLIAGKGHERHQHLGRHRRPFDDRTWARAALERWPA